MRKLFTFCLQSLPSREDLHGIGKQCVRNVTDSAPSPRRDTPFTSDDISTLQRSHRHRIPALTLAQRCRTCRKIDSVDWGKRRQITILFLTGSGWNFVINSHG
ncbi:hypothetical protein Bbelb_383630 [Branchiostoma belcheri]|nr:hypothetical protein Bbelb_383630 [Branchiostoma belcheri]